ncbi:unnamed protein product [Urochloa humidicola]
MATSTASARSSSTSTAADLLLYLSLSTASKVIAKKEGCGGFRCRTCCRCFATFQTLSGHRTSHNRPRLRANGLDLLLGTTPGKGVVFIAASNDVLHRCNTCGMVFATGQVLGGHMRRHRAVVSEPAAGTAFVNDSEDGAGHHLRPIKLIEFI